MKDLEKFYFFPIKDDEENPIDILTGRELSEDDDEFTEKILKDAVPISEFSSWYKEHPNKFILSYQLDEMTEDEKTEITEFIIKNNISFKETNN